MRNLYITIRNTITFPYFFLNENTFSLYLFHDLLRINLAKACTSVTKILNVCEKFVASITKIRVQLCIIIIITIEIEYLAFAMQLDEEIVLIQQQEKCFS